MIKRHTVSLFLSEKSVEVVGTFKNGTLQAFFIKNSADPLNQVSFTGDQLPHVIATLSALKEEIEQ